MTPEPNDHPVPETTPAAGGDSAVLSGGEAPQSKRVLKWVIAAGIVALVAYPLIQRLSSNDPGASASTPDPNSGDAQLNQSLQAYQAGKYQEAILDAQGAIKANPKMAAAYNNLAVSYLQLKNYDEATRSAEEAIRLQPDFQLAKNNLAWIQQEKAKASGPPPAPPKPGSAEYLLNESLQDYQAGKFQESIDAAQKALKVNPQMAVAYNNIAAAYASMKMWEPAIVNAQKALQIAPDMQLARNNLNWALNGKAEAMAKKK